MKAETIVKALDNKFALVVKYVNNRVSVIRRAKALDETTIFANDNQFINLNNVTSIIVCEDEYEASNAKRN